MSGARWASEAYRHNSPDTRFSYRWDPDRSFNRRPDPRFDYERDDRYRY